MNKKYGVKYTVAGMISWLKNHKFSFIKPHSMPAKTDPLQQAKFVEAYKSLKANTPADEPIIFLGAVHPTIATKVAYGCIRKCTLKLVKSTAYKARINIIGAINLKTMYVEIADYKTVNCESLVDFFDVLREKYSGGDKIHVTLDSGPTTPVKTQEMKRKKQKTQHYPQFLTSLQPKFKSR